MKFKKAFSILFVLFFLYGKVFSQMRQAYLDSAVDNNIHKLSFYSDSEGYVAFSNWIGYTIDSGRTFTKKYITISNVDYNGYSVNLTFGFGINGVKAFNRDTLIAYGDYGFVPAILYSTNGGSTFKLVFQSLYNPLQFNVGITDMVFPENNNIGYAVDADRILKTTNKGLSWTSVWTDPARLFDHLEAVDNNNVFAYSTDYTANKLLKTTNAGSSWQQVSLPGSQKIDCADFLTTTKGWIVTTDANTQAGNVYYTTNQGSSWTQKNNSQASSFSTDRMVFINDSTGYALAGGLFELSKTTDSGKVWERLPRDNQFTYLGFSNYDLQLWGNTQLWAGGGHGFLELSTNSGGTTLPAAYFKLDTTNVYNTGTVQLQNFSKPGYQYTWLVNNVFVSSAYNATYMHVLASGLDSIMLVVTKGGISDTLVKYQAFNVPPLPSISSFTPSTGSTGTFITITGNNFTGITSVNFGGIPAASFTVLSATKITAVVAGGATGNVSLTNVYGTFSSPGFTYHAPPSSPPPTVTSVFPSSGLIGTPVTITGTNFDPVPANNIVYFGATRSTVTFASSTQITCSVPAGATFVPVSVLNTTTHLSAHSLKPFNVMFADSSNFTGHSFSEIFKFPLDIYSYPKYTEGKDMDGDGKPDVIGVVAVSGRDSLCAFRNTSAGGVLSFASRQNFALVSNLSSGIIATGDLDGDGKADVVSVTNNVNVLAFRNISVLGNISLSAPLDLATSDGTLDVVVDDLDNDGRPDLAVAGFNNSRLSVLRNTSAPGALSFGPRTDYLSGGNTSVVKVGDLDGDGRKDVVCLNYLYAGPCNISIFQNHSSVGSLSLAAKVDMSAPGTAVQGKSLLLADYDGDDKLDILILNDNRYAIFRNTSTVGSISFASAIIYTLSGVSQGGNTSNLNGDAKPDFIAGSWGGGSLSLYRNLSISDSVMNDTPVPVSNYSAYYTNSADFNLDGKEDIIVSSSHDLAILKNTMGVAIRFSVCQNDYTSIDADLSGSSYQWQQDSGSGFVNVSDSTVLSGTETATLHFSKVPLSWDGFKYRVIVDGRLSSTFIIKVKGFLAPSVTISTPLTTICSGTSATFTATGINGGDFPYYIWKVNGVDVIGNNSSAFSTSSLKDKDRISVILHSSDYCSNYPNDTSNVITMKVNGGVPSVSLSPVSATICAGSTATFVAKPVNGGTTPVYQWQVNGINLGTNSDTLRTSQLISGDNVKVIMTPTPSSCGSYQPAESNVVPLTVNPTVAPSVTISSTGSNICSGMQTLFTATPVNGGTAPSYQWQVNGINVGTNDQGFSSQSLSNNDQVKVVMVSNASCASPGSVTSNTITMSVNGTAITPSVTISAPATTICLGANVTFTANPVNGGTTPVYRWQVDGVNVGTNSNTYTSSNLTNGSVVKVIMTSNATCAWPVIVASNPLSMSLHSTPAADAGPDKSICSGTKSTIGTAALAGISYSWSPATGLSSASLAQPTASATATTQYILTVSNTAGCTAKDTVIVSVVPAPPAPVITQVGNVLSSSAPNGNQWYKDSVAIGGAIAQTYTATSSGVYTVRVSLNGCSSTFSNAIHFVATGIYTPSWNQSILMGPNPVKDNIFIQYKGNSAIFQFRLMDANGRLMAQGGFSSSYLLNMRPYSAGTYIVQIINLRTNEQVQRPIVKL